MWFRRQPKTRRDLAAVGENAAARYLQARGYAILERNYRTRRGEIDLIARHQGDLVFVEVKSRTPTDAFAPGESVTAAKRRKIAALARVYLMAGGGRDERCRFDVVEVTLDERGRVLEVNLLPAAFRL